MTRSPTRLFFFLALFFAIAGSFFYFLQVNIIRRMQSQFPPFPELALARNFQQTGQIDHAILEYKDVVNSDLPDSVKAQAYIELVDLLEKNTGFLGRLESYEVYAIWRLVPGLYILSTLFFLLWLFMLFIKLFFKRPELVVLPLSDFSGLKIGESLPQLASDRIRELKWRLINSVNTSLALSETLDVPLIEVIKESEAIDVSVIVETALLFSGRSTNIPLSRIFDSLRLWFKQPKYIARGDIEASDDNFSLHLILTNRDKKTIEHTWSIKVERLADMDTIRQVVDSVIYPLMFYFKKKKSTSQWEAFKALCDGFEFIDFYKEKGYDTEYLMKARTSIEKALKIDPNYDYASYNLGLLLLRLGEYELAKDTFNQVSSSSTDHNLRQFALYSYAVSLFELSQQWSYKRAIEVLNRIVQDSNIDDLVLMSRSTLAITYSRLAERDINQREHLIRLAREQVQIIKLEKTAQKMIFATALAAEGYINIILGKLDAAISNFNQAIENNSENVSCWIGLGDALLRNKQHDQAISTFHKAETLSPSSGYPCYRLGNIYRDLGDVENAIESYRRASQFSLANLSLGKIYLNNQEYEIALDLFRKAVNQNKRLVDGWVNIAWTISEMESNDEALHREAEVSARRALQLEKNQSQIWHKYAILSKVLLLEGKNDKALIAAKKAIELAPNQPQAIFYCALAEDKLGHSEKAIEYALKIQVLDKGEWRTKADLLIEHINRTFA